jgi:hypothetical protein
MWWELSWLTIQQEFSDLGDAQDITRVVVRLIVAVVLGGLLGYERESIGAPAGQRTHMLVALGSAIFVLIPLQAGMKIEDLSRVLQGVKGGDRFPWRRRHSQAARPQGHQGPDHGCQRVADRRRRRGGRDGQGDHGGGQRRIRVRDSVPAAAQGQGLSTARTQARTQAQAM